MLHVRPLDAATNIFMTGQTTKRCYYEVLGIERDASQADIASAYRRMAIKYHPDKNPGDDEAIARFKEAAEAFEILGDKQKRPVYDQYGHAGIDGQIGGGAHFTDVEDIFSAFGDLFGDIFGGAGGSRRGPRRGRDVRCDVSLTLHEAATGANKSISFERHHKCSTCDGSGSEPGTQPEMCDYCGGHGKVIQSAGIVRMQTTCPSCRGSGSVIKSPCKGCQGSGYVLRPVKTDVKMPAGVDDGMRVRIAGQGEPSTNGGPPGDCYCFVSIVSHPLFERDGQHLICRIPITYPQAALGTMLEIPTLQGRDEIEIPAGTQTGEVFRLRGRGMPDPRRHGLGDLLVQVMIEVPKTITDDEENLLRELADVEHTNVAPHRKSFFKKLKDYFTADDHATPTED